MGDMPERIWAWIVNGWGSAWNVPDEDADPLAVRYVRADLFDAVKAERDNYKALYEAERDDELLNIARQAGYQDGAEDRRKLEARVKALSEALEFYADESTYVTHYELEACDCCTRIFEPINEDRGETARAALQENADDR